MVRVKNGKTLTTDGPFAETKEQFGDFYTIEVPNLDEAVKWFARAIEVWPIQGIPAAPAAWRTTVAQRRALDLNGASPNAQRQVSR
jgi:predicted RNA polymerase sigma factor